MNATNSSAEMSSSAVTAILTMRTRRPLRRSTKGSVAAAIAAAGSASTEPKISW